MAQVNRPLRPQGSKKINKTLKVLRIPELETVPCKYGEQSLYAKMKGLRVETLLITSNSISYY